ncbi:MAG: twin-arginine translocation signal domain-containing protein, partial [Burkholderiales bacterium]
MDRRAFLKVSAAATAAGSPSWHEAIASSAWRTFEATTRVEILKPRAASRVWLPVPTVDNNDWQKVIDNSWSGNAAKGQILSDGKYGVAMLYADWRAGEERPILELTSRFATR